MTKQNEMFNEIESSQNDEIESNDRKLTYNWIEPSDQKIPYHKINQAT